MTCREDSARSLLVAAAWSSTSCLAFPRIQAAAVSSSPRSRCARSPEPCSLPGNANFQAVCWRTSWLALEVTLAGPTFWCSYAELTKKTSQTCRKAECLLPVASCIPLRGHYYLQRSWVSSGYHLWPTCSQKPSCQVIQRPHGNLQHHAQEGPSRRLGLQEWV